MKINSMMVSILSTVIIFSVNGIAQKKRTQPTKSTLKIETNNCSFSEREIDLTNEQLPINYLGNNPQAITNEIIMRGKFVKGEFETTVQFQDRIANEKKKKIVVS